MKWDPSNAHDNAHDGFTGSTIFDCYRLTGEHLWRIDMGPNIRSGAHYVPFIVYDLDGDGCAELMVKTADGTVDGKGNVIGDATKDWREGAAEAKKNFEKNKEQIKQEEANRAKMREEWAKLRKEMEELRKQGKQPDEQMMQRMRRMRGSGNRGPAKAGRILSGPEYMTVFNGRTGEAMATVDPYPIETPIVTIWNGLSRIGMNVRLYINGNGRLKSNCSLTYLSKNNIVYHFPFLSSFLKKHRLWWMGKAVLSKYYESWLMIYNSKYNIPRRAKHWIFRKFNIKNE